MVNNSPINWQKGTIAGIKNFLPEISDTLHDADPMVRIAATYALVEMEDIRSLIQALSLLRGPVVRREAARILSHIGTVKAFRGLIMASRDPDREVRVNVVKALEKLETNEGKEKLHTLEEDPDNKIRKHTHWALERLKAKELV